MPSTFTWLDHSESQRRKMMDAIDLFREQSTRDELGIAGIRDGFSDLLFPGTGALQTRARYFFLVPWMYRQFEAQRIPSSEIVRRARQREVGFISVLATQDDRQGTIGIRGGSDLQRLPSSIYWSSMSRIGIRSFAGSQAEYHRSLDAFYRGLSRGVKTDDGESLQRVRPNWHPGLDELAVTAGYPDRVALRLNNDEATFLRERILTTAHGSLMGFLVGTLNRNCDAKFSWDLEEVSEAPDELRRHHAHARKFSEAIAGAAILYNIMLTELAPVRPDWREKLNERFASWSAMVLERIADLKEWNRNEFWRVVSESGATPNARTKVFVDMWLDLVLEGRPQALVDNDLARRMIAERERQLKGLALARLHTQRAREMWNGAAGLGRLEYRWSNAQTILNDIMNGLGKGSDARAA